MFFNQYLQKTEKCLAETLFNLILSAFFPKNHQTLLLVCWFSPWNLNHEPSLSSNPVFLSEFSCWKLNPLKRLPPQGEGDSCPRRTIFRAVRMISDFLLVSYCFYYAFIGWYCNQGTIERRIANLIFRLNFTSFYMSTGHLLSW